jgi:predicted nucleic acid-binding protein
MVYALDTNIVIRYLRNDVSVRQGFNDAVVRGDNFVVTRVVHYEMMRGFHILNAPNKELAYNVLIGPLGFCNIAEMDLYCWERAEHIYAELYRKGFTIGETDILIASICLENNYTLVTDNVKHFKDIDGLQWENWVR